MWILKLEMAHKEAVCIREKEWGDSETVGREKQRYWYEELQFHCLSHQEATKWSTWFCSQGS